MPNENLFGFDDPVRALIPPAGFETVHLDGDTWAKTDGTREGTTRLSVQQANLMAGWFRGLRTIAGVDLSDLANTDPMLLRETIARSIAASLPAEVANQLPALADLLDTDIDLVAALAASADFKNAVAADPDLANAVAADPDLVNALAALTAFVDAVAAALPLALNADNLASGTVPNARLPGRLQEVASLQTDADAITTTGFYRLANTAANIPVAQWGYLWHVRFDNQGAYQEWQQTNATARYARRMNASVWGAWYLLQPAQSDQDARYARLAAANNFTQQQTATSFKSTSGDFDSRAPVAANAHFWLRDEAGNPKAVVYWDRTPNDLNITNWGTAQALVLKGTGGLWFAGNNVRDTSNTPNLSDAAIIDGTGTVPGVPTAAGIKLGAQTWGGGRLKAILQDQRASGTSGGTATAGSWYTRTLNTEAYDPDGIVSIASNQFTPTVDCECAVQAAFVGTGPSQIRIYNVTDSTVAGLGTVVGSGVGSDCEPVCHAVAALTAGKTYRIEARVSFTVSSQGNGAAANFGTEVYTNVALRSR